MRTWPALELGRLGAGLRPGANDPDQPPITERIQAALTDYEVAAVEEISSDSWRVFFHDVRSRDGAADDLSRQFGGLTVWPVDVADEDWAARSQAGLRAVYVGRIVVAPPWDIPPEPHGEHNVIVIQPSMGFGTGHHATTRLCLRAMQQAALRGRRVLDAGTGSGVLAIAASRLGAQAVLAIDDDADALRAAGENVALNSASNVDLRLSDLRHCGEGDGFDVVVANLSGALLIGTASELKSLTAPHGQMILSGFTIDEESPVCRAFSGMPILRREQEEGWVCVTVELRSE